MMAGLSAALNGSSSYGLGGGVYGGSALAPGVTIVNGKFYYQGKPLDQATAAKLNNGTLGSTFSPYQAPSSPPPGTYDPALDAQQQNSDQGFEWASQDYGLTGLRNDEDYATASKQGAQQHQWSLADLLTGQNRTQEDYGTSTQRLGQDYGRATGDLNTSYHNLAGQQQGNINAAGESEGGALAQAMAKRATNQAHDQSGLDLNYQRGTQDLNTGLSRSQQDYGTNVDRTDTQYGWQTQALGTQHQRAADDNLTNYSRQGVQHDTFGHQINAEKTYGAQQAGLLPEGPSNEFQNSGGQTYREEVNNGVLYHHYSDGLLVPIRRVA